VTLYGLYVRDLEQADLVWFTTDAPLKPGRYRKGRKNNGPPDVYLADSIPLLILTTGAVVDAAETRAQELLATQDLPEDVRRRIGDGMLTSLIESLHETSPIWEVGPDWIDELSWAGPLMEDG